MMTDPPAMTSVRDIPVGTGNLARGQRYDFQYSSAGSTLSLYAALWLAGAIGLTTAHAISGGHYEKPEPSIIRATKPSVRPTAFNDAPSFIDPFPAFEDERIIPLQAWATAPSAVPTGSKSPIPYRVTTEFGVVGSMAASASAVRKSDRELTNITASETAAAQVGAYVAQAKPADTAPVGAGALLSTSDSPDYPSPGPGLIDMHDPVPALVATSVGAPTFRRAGRTDEQILIVAHKKKKKPGKTTSVVCQKPTSEVCRAETAARSANTKLSTSHH